MYFPVYFPNSKPVDLYFFPSGSVCVNGTWRTNSFDCTKCSDPVLSVFFVGLTIFVIVVILVATIIVTIVDEETETAIDLQMVKIMVNHLVISSSTSKLPLKWSPLLQSVFNAFGKSNATDKPLTPFSISFKYLLFDSSTEEKPAY